MMTYQFELLDTIVAELSERNPRNTEASPLLLSECKKLKRAIPNHVLTLKNETQIRSYLRMVLTKLGELLELLYDADRAENPDADRLLEVLKTVLRHYEDALPNEVLLPKCFCVEKSGDFERKWQEIRTQLEARNVDPVLCSLIYFPFSRLILKDVEVSLYDYKYLKLFSAVLVSECTEGISGDEALIELLIGLGFNHSRFKAYYTNALKAKLAALNLTEKRPILEECQVWVAQAISRTPLLFDPEQPRLGEVLHNWIDIELKKGLSAGKDDFDHAAENEHSFNTVMTTSELSAWLKLQLDAGIYVERNIDVFTGKVSVNFKTKRGMQPSSKSVKAKLYGKDPEVYRALRPFVNKMKEDIDRFLM